MKTDNVRLVDKFYDEKLTYPVTYNIFIYVRIPRFSDLQRTFVSETEPMSQGGG